MLDVRRRHRTGKTCANNGFCDKDEADVCRVSCPSHVVKFDGYPERLHKYSGRSRVIRGWKEGGVDWSEEWMDAGREAGKEGGRNGEADGMEGERDGRTGADRSQVTS